MASTLDERYAFTVDWFDNQAQISRDYVLFFYPSDTSIEMYDVKNHRTFLKRNKYPIRLEELFVGAQVNVFSRQLNIKEFADAYTLGKLSKEMER